MLLYAFFVSDQEIFNVVWPVRKWQFIEITHLLISVNSVWQWKLSSFPWLLGSLTTWSSWSLSEAERFLCLLCSCFPATTLVWIRTPDISKFFRYFSLQTCKFMYHSQSFLNKRCNVEYKMALSLGLFKGSLFPSLETYFCRLSEISHPSWESPLPQAK